MVRDNSKIPKWLAEEDAKEDPYSLEQKLMDYAMCKTKLNGIIPKNRNEVIKWNGWGYNDSKFIIKPVGDGLVAFTGNRYPIGDLDLPHFTQWVKDIFEVDINHKNHPAPLPPPEAYPKSLASQEFLEAVDKAGISKSLDGVDRLVRCHGQTLHDIYTLRFNLKKSIPRIPDVVVWPETTEHVVTLVALAERMTMVIIPYGGGTSVSGAVTCPDNEPRPIISLDTTQMNQIFYVDKKNLLISCQCGIVGQDLERFLQSKGFTVGHEPDSYEFSTVGGWVATRASGMKKNVYGNIEDLLVSATMVTPSGILHKKGLHPRQSVGPDFNHVILGSEGTLGVVTEVVLKIRPVAEVRKYGSVVFPTFTDGVNCMREIAKQRCQPASIRLMDNEQFRFGQTLKPAGGFFNAIVETIKKAYLTNVKGFDLERICVATLLFEGSKKSVEQQEARINNIVKDFGGMPAGEKNGERGYMLTFVIAYIRDIGLEFNVVAESFETSVPWKHTLNLCRNVKYVIGKECARHKVKRHFISHRVTQTYDSGCCVYFYFAFNWQGLDDPVGTYEAIEAAAREEILANQGSLSHHHGVGKLRARWYKSQVSELGENLYRQAKRALDPNNVFGVGNLLTDEEPPLKAKL
ncbi:Alkyldihydroxyacetonephosphate synthase [Nesidiocoris tenuis]|uniref:Alkylglycerone-phosphate synthase n=1 Tax=Nesidiocoris tenuis TaxID=355587 RepID=A0ABN7BCS9_9HEMI|nr:Alkyldihydroxyacetonephosphate synthase [Nesidiocoris tenuis]